MRTPSPSPTPSLEGLMRLDGRTAIVTGAAMGIGRAIAERLHEAGASVTIADLDLAAAQRVARGLEARRYGSAFASNTDISDALAVDRLVSATCDRFGGVTSW